MTDTPTTADAEALCEHLERKLDFKIGGEVMFQIPANRDSVAVAAFIRQQQAEIAAAETRGWNAAIDAAVEAMKIEVGKWDNLPGTGSASRRIIKLVRTLAKPEGTPNA